MPAQELARIGFECGNCFTRISEIPCAHSAAKQHAVDAFEDSDALPDGGSHDAEPLDPGSAGRGNHLNRNQHKLSRQKLEVVLRAQIEICAIHADGRQYIIGQMTEVTDVID